jgi:phosphomannomutase
MSFPESIFKAYDIRGLVDGQLSEEIAYGIGRAFVAFLRTQNTDFFEKSLVVGRDMRPSGDRFTPAVIRGITDEGVNVVEIGLASTPLFNFACAHYPKHAGGIMVTASHNPAEYNGFKLTMGNGLPVGGKNGMDVIREAVRKNKWTAALSRGTVVQKNVLSDYEQKLFELVDPKTLKNFKIVIDAGNGMGQTTFPDWLKKLPLEVEYLYLDPDGTFPNHEANPLKLDTLKKLQERVLETKADFGFALDGDCDRIGLVDETGTVVDASFVGALLGLETLRSHPGGHMLYDLRSSMIVPEVWEKNGATTEMCQVGHANIKKAMRETQAIFASELSQHLYYGDMYNLESSDLSLLYVLQLLSREDEKLSELAAPLKKYFHSGEINFEIEDKIGAMQRLEEKYGSSATEISRLDGLMMKFDWGWFGVRASNTEPVLRLNLETMLAEDLHNKVGEVSERIQKI